MNSFLKILQLRSIWGIRENTNVWNKSINQKKMNSFLKILQLRFIWGILENVETYCSPLRQNRLTSHERNLLKIFFQFDFKLFCSGHQKLFYVFQTTLDEWECSFLWTNCHNQIFSSAQIPHSIPRIMVVYIFVNKLPRSDLPFCSNDYRSRRREQLEQQTGRPFLLRTKLAWLPIIISTGGHLSI